MRGEIKLKNRAVPNILGEVNNYLQQTIYAMESEEGRILFDRMCFHESAAGELGVIPGAEALSLSGRMFYYV